MEVFGKAADTMDLSQLTIEELEQMLGEVDTVRSPAMALELSNEIGRRREARKEKTRIRSYAVRSTKLSPLIALVCIMVAAAIATYRPPDMRSVLIAIGIGVFMGLANIRLWLKNNYGFYIVALMLFGSQIWRFGDTFFGQALYVSLVTGAAMSTIVAFKEKILSSLEGCETSSAA